MKFILSLLFLTSAFATDWQGHRGARGLYPENTIGGMEEALKYPVTTLELDVVISKDHKVIVSHEPWFNTDICKSEKKNLYRLNYEEIITVDCGSLPHPRFPQQHKANVGKPLLSVLIHSIEDRLKKLDRQVTYSVEIKSTPDQERNGFQPDYKKFTDLVLEVLLNHLDEKRFMVQSFDWRVLRYLKDKYPSVRVVALREDSYAPEKIVPELGFVPEVFSPHYKLLSRTHVEHFHKLGVKVIPWTVNTLPEMRELLNMGVDGLITDYPNLIVELEKKQCPEGQNLFEGKCVKIPAHAIASSSNPGWICKEGYVQKRNRCIKIPMPANSHLSPDGKTWVCNEGYVRYRGSCKKQ